MRRERSTLRRALALWKLDHHQPAAWPCGSERVAACPAAATPVAASTIVRRPPRETWRHKIAQPWYCRQCQASRD